MQVTRSICLLNHDLYSSVIEWQVCAKCRAFKFVAIAGFRGCAAQKKPRSRGERGEYEKRASRKEGTSNAPKGRRKDAQCLAER